MDTDAGEGRPRLLVHDVRTRLHLGSGVFFWAMGMASLMRNGRSWPSRDQEKYQNPIMDLRIRKTNFERVNPGELVCS